MRVRRSFNDEFKAKIIETIAAGAATQAGISRKYGIFPVMQDTITNIDHCSTS